MINATELKLGDMILDISGNPIMVESLSVQKAKDGDLYLINGYLQEHFSPMPKIQNSGLDHIKIVVE